MTMTTTPELNTPLIVRLVQWADQDEKFEKRIGDFLSEVQWDQRFWASGGQESIDRAAYREVWRNARSEADALRESLIDLQEFVKDRNICGTSHCQAGGAVVSEDYRIIYPAGGAIAEWCVPIQRTGAVRDDGRPIYRDVPGAQPRRIMEVGQELLGLTAAEASDYFGGSNTITMLKSYANLFAKNRGLPPIFFKDDGTPYDNVDLQEEIDDDEFDDEEDDD